jgi:hypothetical protein
MPVQSRAWIEGCRANAFIPVQAVDTVTAQEEHSGGAEGWGRSDLTEGATESRFCGLEVPPVPGVSGGGRTGNDFNHAAPDQSNRNS